MALFKFNDDNLLVSLDIGSYAIRCAVFQKSTQNPLKLISFKEQKSQGLAGAQVIHFEKFHSVLSELLAKSENFCKRSFSEIFLGFSPNFHNLSSQGMAALISREVTQEDVDLTIKTACAINIPKQETCIHAIPNFFSVDGQKPSLNPIGAIGLRLEAKVQLITIAQHYCQNIQKSLQILGYAPREFVHNLIAFGNSFTSFQQKKQGICVCDIGYKTSRLLVYHQGKILATFIINMGGDHFTEALAQKFHIPKQEAEHLKETQGQIFYDDTSKDLSMQALSDLYLSRKLFSQTLEASAEQLLQKIKQTLDHYKILNLLDSGFIFTGGTAYLPGFIKLASFFLEGQVAHPTQIYQNFRHTNNFSIIKQAYENNKTKSKKSSNRLVKKFHWKNYF